VPNRLRRKEIRILSIDGGGIRGLVPAMVVEALEGHMQDRKRPYPLYRTFDVISGSSTGALIALGLTAPAEPGKSSQRAPALLTGADVVKLYRQKGPIIFPAAERTLRSRFSHAFRPKYDSEPFEGVLQEVYGERTMKELLCEVVVPTYDTVHRRPRLFKRRPARGSKEVQNFYVRDVARAAAAAPTYFAPAKVVPIPDNGYGYSLVDGGVFANNPALMAYIEARKLFPRARRFTIVSLGTGIVDRPYPHETVSKWGYMDWMSSIRGTPLLGMMMDGQSDNALYLLQRLPGVELHRFDFHLEQGHTFMDDTSEENFTFLEERGRRLVRQNENDLKTLAAKL
ncbi:MAG: patatin-like phospholipase family protein, partial [Spirochaetota bacterium]